MGQETRYWCPWETRRLMWLMGMMFAVIIAIQYVELPYGSILSFVSSSDKIVGAGNSSLSMAGVSSKPEMFNDMTKLSGLNSSDPIGSDKAADNDREGKATDDNNAPLSEGVSGSNKFSGLYNQDEESSNDQSVDLSLNSTGDAVDSSGSKSAPKETEQSFLQGTITFKSENTGVEGTDTSPIPPALTPVNSSPNTAFSRTMEPNITAPDVPGLYNQDKESSNDQSVDLSSNSAGDAVNSSGSRSAAKETEQSLLQGNITFKSENTGVEDANTSPIPSALAPVNSSPSTAFPRNMEPNSTAPDVPSGPIISAVDNNVTSFVNNTGSGERQGNLNPVHNISYKITVPQVKKMPKVPNSAVISISEMHNLLLQSWSSPYLVRPHWSSAVDQELLQAKSHIENAPVLENDPMLYAPLYRNVTMFKRSYELMEEMLKVYVYREGEKPILHQPVLSGIYASEGWFMKLLEANKKFITKDPRRAHLFYLPFSSRNLEETLYVANSHSHKNLVQYLKTYLDVIAAKYPFWNRTDGADHFLVACHDWAPSETRKHMANCIRALCNSDVKEGFVFGKDVSLPETYVRTPQKLLRDRGGKPASKRKILAFFAGQMHGYVRPILLKHWENKDPDMKIYGPMPKVKGQRNYIQHMKSSRYCICAKGYEVNSPRVVEAIFYECVPVIISDNFVPPFFEVLNWESFAVFISEKDIPRLKEILASIPRRKYLQMQMRVKKVQQHFLWHATPEKYDIFHMILHSVWFNRVFQTSPT